MKKKQLTRILTFTAALLTYITISAANPIGGIIPDPDSAESGQEIVQPDNGDEEDGEPGISPQNDKETLVNNNV